MEDLTLDSKVMESDLIPLVKEKSVFLPHDSILIAKNKKTNKIGQYVFDRYHHQFLEVVMSDIEIKQEMPNIAKLINVTMSTKTEQAISIRCTPGIGELKKFHYNRETASFDPMEEKAIVESDEEIQSFIEEIEKTQGEIRRRMSNNVKKIFADIVCKKIKAILWFYHNVKPFLAKKLENPVKKS